MTKTKTISINNGCSVECSHGSKGGDHVEIRFLDANGSTILIRYIDVDKSPATALKATIAEMERLIHGTGFGQIQAPRVQAFAAKALLQAFSLPVAA